MTQTTFHIFVRVLYIVLIFHGDGVSELITETAE
jgi:hypothetical protein